MIKLKRWVLKHADEVVVNSSATRKACQEIYSDKPYPIIPMGIDLNNFPYNAPEDSKGLQLLFVGRLSYEKGAMITCQAVQQFIEQVPKQPISLTIVGDGPERTKIESYIREHNLGKLVKVAGWKQHHEIGEYFKRANVFIGPSIEDRNGWQEAFGLTFAEAAASGLPVIATNNGGIKDVVLDGQTGLLVEQKSPQAIVIALQKLSDPGLRRKMGRAGRKHIEENFSWQVITKHYVRLLSL